MERTRVAHQDGAYRRAEQLTDERRRHEGLTQATGFGPNAWELKSELLVAYEHKAQPRHCSRSCADSPAEQEKVTEWKYVRAEQHRR